MEVVLDPELVLERFVVGSGNRLAAAAARRAAESPGRVYNPLVISGPPGLGKTHLLHAIGHLARRVEPGLHVHYETADSFAERLSASLATGDLDLFREENLRIGFMLLDDVQEVAGKHRTQSELLELWDEMLRWEVQLVVASERPPAEIPDLDPQLVGRLSGGLTVEIGPPDAETRAALLRRWRGEPGAAPLSEGLLAYLSALPIRDVRTLRSALERVAERAADEGREPTEEEVDALLALDPEPAREDEFVDFVSDVSTAVAAVVETEPWRRSLARAILRWEGEGIRTRRLEAALEADAAPDLDALLKGFERDVARLRRVERELGGRARDRAVLSDPDRVAEAEALLLARRAPQPAADPAVDAWFLDREKLAWDWIALEDRLLEERD